MKELPTDDPLFGKGPLRADGRRSIPAYLFEVKKPEESKGPWDYYKQIATISAEDAAKPLEAQRVSAGEEIAICGRPDVRIRPVPIGTNQQGPAWPTSDPSGPKISLLNLRGSPCSLPPFSRVGTKQGIHDYSNRANRQYSEAASVDRGGRSAAERRPDLDPLYDEAIRDTIERFEATGSPVITDGEQRKYHNFWTYCVHGLPNTPRTASRSRSPPATSAGCRG